MSVCPACNADVLDIDVKCPSCGKPIGTSGAHALIGTVVLSQYTITDVLGQGGMSVVYQAKHKITEQEVALKLLPPELAAHAQVKSRFLEEAKALAQLDHPNIVHLYNFGQENGAFVLAMQYVQGQTWERMILSSGKQEWPHAVRIAIDVLRALEYAHGRGIVHRDMKPSNVLVRDSDGAATVMDFGIAKMTNSTRLTATGQTMGTVRYMSPEQVRGHEVDVRTDLYSLGATLYEALVGDTPFDGNTHFEIMTKHLHEPAKAPSMLGIELPTPLDGAVLRSLAKKPEERFQTARDFRKLLEAVLREADPGHAETQRLQRDSVPPVSRVPNVPAAAAVSTGPTSPSRPARPPAATGLASRLEPTGAEIAVPAKRRTWLWLGLGGLVAAAAAVVAVLMMRGGARSEAAARPDAASKPAVPAPIVAFAPPDVAIAATKQVDADLTVHVSGPWTPDEVIHVWEVVRERFERFATERSTPIKVPTPLTIVVVPARTLCDARTYETGEVPQNCQTLGQYYRPAEQTLLIADDRPRLDVNLGVGLATAVCIQRDADPRACELVEPFEQAFGKGS